MAASFSFRNQSVAATAAWCRALTDDEVRAIRPGDFVLEAGEWCRIESLTRSLSVCGWPVAHVVAAGVDNPLFRASLCISRALPARRVRFQ